MKVASTVLVIGGAGYFGRLLVKELLEFTNCQIIVGGRKFNRVLEACRRFGSSFTPRLLPQAIDLTESKTIEPALVQAAVAICAAGPFQQLPTTLLSLCLEKGVPYIDLSDDREFVRKIHSMVAARPDRATLPSVCTGWSAVPALSGVLARIAVDDLLPLYSIDIQIAPGNRLPRSAATVASLLASVGRRFSVWRDSGWYSVTGWSEPRAFIFPSPVGRRMGYLTDVPDHDLFPPLFGANRVEFRVGSELSLLNQWLVFLTWLAKKGWVRDWSSRALLLRRGMSLLGFLGHDWGALGVEAFGVRGRNSVRRRVCLVADRAGQCIPVMPAVIMAETILSGESSHKGLVPIDGWISQERLKLECARRGYRLIIEEKS